MSTTSPSHEEQSVTKFPNTRLDRLVKELRLPEHVRISRPTMPDLEKFNEYLQDMWSTGVVTNIGKYHREFEEKLQEYLGVEHVNVFNNGTTALLVALHSLRIKGGEVITTPFTFSATPHSLYWNGIKPVFCDIDPNTMNIDANKIESLISPETKAIMPVHVFGIPCDIDKIQAIADTYGLKVIYDAAHTFGAKYRGRALSDYGDMAMISFHAAKLFSSIEGGALVVKTPMEHRRINYLKNFGIVDEDMVCEPGINGKMSELHAAYGLLNLERVADEMAKRKNIDKWYREGLKGIPGIGFPAFPDGFEWNYGYFPMLVEADEYGMDRNELAEFLKRFNVGPRKYFHPLCSHYPCYASLPSSSADRLPETERIAKRVLCMPIYGTLEEATIKNICQIIRELRSVAA